LSAILCYHYRPRNPKQASGRCCSRFWLWLSDVETIACKYCAHRIATADLSEHHTSGDPTKLCWVLSRYAGSLLTPPDESQFVESQTIRLMLDRALPNDLRKARPRVQLNSAVDEKHAETTPVNENAPVGVQKPITASSESTRIDANPTARRQSAVLCSIITAAGPVSQSH